MLGSDAKFIRLNQLKVDLIANPEAKHIHIAGIDCSIELLSQVEHLSISSEFCPSFKISDTKLLVEYATNLLDLQLKGLSDINDSTISSLSLHPNLDYITAIDCKNINYSGVFSTNTWVCELSSDQGIPIASFINMDHFFYNIEMEIGRNIQRSYNL